MKTAQEKVKGNLRQCTVDHNIKPRKLKQNRLQRVADTSQTLLQKVERFGENTVSQIQF